MENKPRVIAADDVTIDPIVRANDYATGKHRNIPGSTFNVYLLRDGDADTMVKVHTYTAVNEATQMLTWKAVLALQGGIAYTLVASLAIPGYPVARMVAKAIPA